MQGMPRITVHRDDMKAAARTSGLQITVLNASNSDEIDAAFASLVRERQDALFVSPDPLFAGRRVQLVLLAARHAIPATFPVPDIAEAGGLMSYGTDIADRFDKWAPMPAVSSGAPSARTCRSGGRPGSSGHQSYDP